MNDVDDVERLKEDLGLGVVLLDLALDFNHDLRIAAGKHRRVLVHLVGEIFLDNKH